MQLPTAALKSHALALLLIAGLAGCDSSATMTSASAPNQDRMTLMPEMRWGDRSGSTEWTRAALQALDHEGISLLSSVPSDVSTFCPGYPALDSEGRKHFWAGLLSALSKHESGFNPAAQGGGGRYLGLMQISPATAQHYGCDGKMLDGSNNMACAVKIAARNVSRDNAIVSDQGNGWRGIARDWMPLRSSEKRADIAAWTRQQSYCGT